jgi:pilus assembly protein Flp/PilA
MTLETLRRLASCRSGATAIEYGLIVAGIFLAIVAAIGLLSGNMTDMYNTISNAVIGNM